MLGVPQRRVRASGAMPDRVCAELAARATRKRLKKGQRVLGRGDATVLVLATGRLEVVGEAGGVVRSLLPPAVAGISVAAGAEPTAELRAAELNQEAAA